MPTTQRDLALKKANAIRISRANTKKAIRAREVSVFEVISDPPQDMLTASVMEVLCAVERAGRTYVNRTCQIAMVNPATELGRLTVQQRERLLRAMLDAGVFRKQGWTNWSIS